MKIAVVGAGVTGAYLLNRIPAEHHVECFERRPEDKWYTVCAWGTSEPFISDLFKMAGFNFQDYVLHRGKRMLVDLGGGRSFEIKLKGLVTYDKHRLTHDMLEGHTVHWGSQVKEVNGQFKDFDMVVDATGLPRSLLPKIEQDVVIPSVEYQVKSKELPYDDFYLRPYPGLCVTADTLVMANPGVKTIGEVVEGERVLTKDGWVPVSRTYKRQYSGDVVRITPFLCGFNVGLTPDHLVWVMDRKTREVGWKRARDVRECHSKSAGDYVAFPIPACPEVGTMTVSDYVHAFVKGGRIYPKGRNQFGAEFPYGKPISNELTVTDELGEFFGYYVSEGSAFSNGIILSNFNESIFARMKELGELLFNVDGEEYVPHQVQFNSTILRRWFIALFGEGALNKRIPMEVFGFPRSAKIALISSLFKGDGAKETRLGYNHISYTSRSKMLAFGLWQLLLNIGIVGSVAWSRSSRSYRIRVHGKQLTQLGDVFGKLNLTDAARVSRKYILKDEMLYFAVKRVSRAKIRKTFVHDLGTNGSFTTSFLIHNSGYYWYFPLGDGMGHIGAGDYFGKYRGELEDFIKKYHCEVVRKIGRPVRVKPPYYCRPFFSGKVTGVGESIGTVYPMLGEGIIPSMQCANLFVEYMQDREGYEKAVLEKFDVYAKVYRFIQAKLDGDFSLLRYWPTLLSIFIHMKRNETRYGLEIKLTDIFKVMQS